MRRRCFLLQAAAVVGASPALAQGAPQPLERRAPLEVRDEGLVGRFHVEPNARRRTAVLLLGGSDGGYPSPQAARNLAQSGYPTLALAYFRGYTGQPEELARTALSRIPLEYVFTALDWLKRRPEVRADRVVLMGESRGAELALQVASLRPDVAGVIAYVPSSLRWAEAGPNDAPAWTLNGVGLPYARGVFDRRRPMDQFTTVLDGPRQVRERAEIAVERITGPVLLISTTADKVWPSARMADELEARLRTRGSGRRVIHRKFDDASHLLMGYGPGVTKFTAGAFTVEFGGSEEGTRRARDAGWALVKDFLAELDRG